MQKLWLHAHHIRHWEDGGPTIASNLVMLCPEDGTLEFRDARGERIEPPAFGAAPLPPPEPHQLQYRQPYAERLNARDFTWN